MFSKVNALRKGRLGIVSYFLQGIYIYMCVCVFIYIYMYIYNYIYFFYFDCAYIYIYNCIYFFILIVLHVVTAWTFL